jgi:predicted xylose isomerase-like sugar epimerase
LHSLKKGGSQRSQKICRKSSRETKLEKLSLDSLGVFAEQGKHVRLMGVLAGKTKAATMDEDRVLVTKDDIMDNRGQVAALLEGGATVPISYEPFSPQVRQLQLSDLKVQLQRSIDYLFG